MKANIEHSRFEQVMKRLHEEAAMAANKTGPITDDEPLEFRLTAAFHKNNDFKKLLAQFTMGFMIMPQETVACLIALGYRMGAEDARAEMEVSELDNLFKLGE